MINRNVFLLLAVCVTLEDPCFAAIMGIPFSNTEYQKNHVFPILGACLVFLYFLLHLYFVVAKNKPAAK
ncbi:hypothetical protein BX070DRAFT_224675 [Coemansia spiralis]|nr:hypothetical protein BX070DRAFT_224675 [Coemansia spiralis]